MAVGSHRGDHLSIGALRRRRDPLLLIRTFAVTTIPVAFVNHKGIVADGCLETRDVWISLAIARRKFSRSARREHAHSAALEAMS
jgi:hypothetical protein